jgi:hypothetical protein
MELRVGRGRRSVIVPQPILSIPQKPCVYKLGNDVCNQDLPSQDRLALYNFEVDENEPLPNKKPKNKRKVRHRKKMGLANKTDNEYTLAATVDKCLLSAGKGSFANQKKQGSSVTVKKEEHVSVADTSLKCQSSERQHNVAGERKGNAPFARTCGGGTCDRDGRTRTAVENMVSVVTDSTDTCHRTIVTNHEPTSMMTGDKGIACVADGASDNGVSVAEGSELNLSVAESERSRGSSSCRSSLLFSPIEKWPSRPAAFVTAGWPARCTDTRGIQSVEDFTVDNYFGFDEESEDDLHLSLSPVKMAPCSKPASSGSFAVSSTPNLRPTFTRPEATSMKEMQKGAQTRTALVPAQSTAAPRHPLASSVDLPDIADAVCDPSPPVLFMDRREPTTHFTKVSLPQGLAVFLSCGLHLGTEILIIVESMKANGL